MLTFTVVFLIALFINIAVDFWLDRRHLACVQKNRSSVPELFAEKVSLEAHQKAADYTTAKMSVGLWHGFYGIALLLAWTLGGGLNWLDQSVQSLEWASLWLGVLFMLGFFMISSLLELPFSLYSTFSVEQRFGFNNMSIALYITDMIKQLLLMVAIGAPLIWVILWLMDSTGEWWWLWAWGVWTGFSVLMMWAYPTFIAPLFNKFSDMEEGELKTAIEALLNRCGFESKGLFVMDGSKRSGHGNAYFTGFGKSKRIVFFDTLLKQLTTDETLAVLAHELGHFKRNHIKKRMILMFSMSLAGFAILGWLAEQDWFYAGLGVAQASNHVLLILFMIALPIFTFALGPVMSFYSRKHEFEADTYAAEHSNGADLVTALVKMYEDNASTLTPDALYSAFHDSHPPASVRVTFINNLLEKS